VVAATAGIDRRSGERVPAAWTTVAVLAVLALCVVSRSADGTVRQLVVNAGVLVLAASGAAGGVLAARAATGRRRWGWGAMAAASASWALGQAVWTVLEDVLAVTTPFPSLADVGYLGFPLLGGLSLWLLPELHGAGERRRRVLDALVVAGSVGLLSWVSVLHALAGAAADSTAALVVSLAYPVGDVVLVTVAIIAAAQSVVLRVPLTLVAGGVVALALSDGAFAYLGATTGYTTGSLVDLGWWTGFAVLGLAGVHAATVPTAEDAPGSRLARRRPSLLPYLPLVAAGVVVGSQVLRGREIGVVAQVLVALLVALVLVRQHDTVRENSELLGRVERRETQLRHQAFHDGLTGLANRALFLDRLSCALDLAAREPRPLSVAYLDLDGFKETNDVLGHAGGDELLVGVAERLQGSLRAGDTLARLGGDEFAVLVEGGTEPGVLAQGLLDALQRPFLVNGATRTVSASIGLASLQAGQPVPTATELLHSADVAMYAVKGTGGGRVLLHSAGAGLVREGAVPLEQALTAALEDGALDVAFQPVVDARTGFVVGCEALARWQHGGVAVPPDRFVPLLDRLGLSAALTTFVLERSCAQLARWSAALGHDRLHVAVNVSPAELSDPGLPERVLGVLVRHGLRPAQLVLEITESGLAHRPDTAQDVVRRLRAGGVGIALDDFGTGWSTLAQLAAMPLDTVKLDRLFLAEVDHDERAERFLQGLLELTRHLGLRTIAEGVERPGQLEVLRRHGCDLVQGHLVCRAVPADELTERVLAGTALLDPAGTALLDPTGPTGSPA
jgi:diguanylate cyclase (GGDEF)-like protein